METFPVMSFDDPRVQPSSKTHPYKIKTGRDRDAETRSRNHRHGTKGEDILFLTSWERP